MNKFYENKKILGIGIAGGFVSGGSLLSYQIMLNYHFSIIISALTAVITGIIIYLIAIELVKKESKK